MIATADSLNADCTCISLDREALSRELERSVGDGAFARRLGETHPTLLSNLPVFLRPDHMAGMAALIASIETVARLSAYQDAALAGAPTAARHKTGAAGVFMGYDFHLGADGPRLIEINTNAGGALINAVLARAQKACCAPAAALLLPDGSRALEAEETFIANFRSEWRNERGEAPLRTVAIVDAAPEGQYLYPEFVLFQRLFERHGIACAIAPPEVLRHEDSRLRYGALAIDLVYNRLTDFGLEQPASAALRSAYLAGDVVLTPNPRAHALFADKRNLVRLTDRALLASWGVAADDIARLLRGIPRTIEVTRARANELWAARSRLFFKPACGYGSKAAYRGDKVTKRVWESILDGGYVAQDLVPPSTRTVIVDGERQPLKIDVRNYTYGGAVQLVAARLYQGQTTNFRTPGGGFAPVLAPGPAAQDCCGPGSSTPCFP